MMDVINVWPLGDIGAFSGVDPASVAEDFTNFRKAGGVTGSGLSSYLNGKLKSVMATEKKKASGTTHDAAWELDYDLKRSELKGSKPVPGWLLDQIEGRVYRLLGSSLPSTSTAAPADAHQHGPRGDEGMGFTTYLLIGGGILAVVGLGWFLLRKKPAAAPMQGLTRRRRRHRR